MHLLKTFIAPVATVASEDAVFWAMLFGPLVLLIIWFACSPDNESSNKEDTSDENANARTNYADRQESEWEQQRREEAEQKAFEEEFERATEMGERQARWINWQDD